MKKTQILLTLVVACASTAFADDYKYPYLIVRATDGTETTLNATALEITFAEGKLVATNGDGTTQLNLVDLATMSFSETGSVTPVTPIKTESGLALADEASDLAATLGEDFSEPAIVNPNALVLTWTSSDESVAVVDEEGNVTLVGAGTTTITASFAGNDEFTAGEITYTLTVSEPEVDAVNALNTTTEVKVFTTSGLFVGTFESVAKAKAVLRKGLYVISVNNKNHKLNIR